MKKPVDRPHSWCKKHKCLARCMQLPLMSAESMQLQTVCDGGPEGISQGCAHAPLMMQEGLCLLCSHPHIPHLPAYPRVTKSAACQWHLKWRASLWQRQSMSPVSGMALPAYYQCVRHSYACAFQLCTVALLRQQSMTVVCRVLNIILLSCAQLFELVYGRNHCNEHSHVGICPMG